MDEITLVNLLNKICEKNQDLIWKLNCKYHDGQHQAIMEVSLLQSETHNIMSQISFSMETGKVLAGRHRGLLAFNKTNNLTDALLDILIFENTKKSVSNN